MRQTRDQGNESDDGATIPPIHHGFIAERREIFTGSATARTPR
jgi:hypothetical protein